MGELLAFAASVTWAFGTANYGKLSQRYPAISVNMARAIYAFPFFVVAIFFEGASGQFSHITQAQVAWLALSAVSSFAVGDWIFLKSVADLGVSVALAIASCFPIWSALAGVFFRGETLSLMQWLGLLITLAGVIYIILLNHRAGEGKNPKRGVILGVLCSLFWFLNSLSVSIASRGLSPGVTNTIRIGFGIVFCMILGKSIIKVNSLWLSKKDYKRYGFLFIFEAFAGSYFYVYGMSHTPLAIGSVLTSLAPAITVPVAWIMGLEKVSYRKLAGVLSVVLGLVMLLGILN